MWLVVSVVVELLGGRRWKKDYWLSWDLLALTGSLHVCFWTKRGVDSSVEAGLNGVVLLVVGSVHFFRNPGVCFRYTNGQNIELSWPGSGCPWLSILVEIGGRNAN